MEPEGIHELTAAYALDALEDDEARAYEEHLRQCEQCRTDLLELREAATALAYAAPPASPPPQLRDRILERAKAERASVIPFRRRTRERWTPVLAAATAVAAAAAIGLGIWAVTLHRDLDASRSARSRDSQALAILASPNALRVPVSGAAGTLTVTDSGEAVLAVSKLRAAPAGKTYEAWVIVGSTPRPAGLFEGGGERASLVRLTRPVPQGATVAVTVERRGGVDRPTHAPILSAQVSSL
jgi:anti-sigma-K factor RskA